MRSVLARCTVAAGTLLVAAQGALAAGPAKEGSYDGMGCYVATPQAITEVKGALGLSGEWIGTLIRKEGEIGYQSSIRCVLSAVAGRETNGSCVQIDPDGDSVFMLIHRKGTDPGTWTALAGTGKYEGMEGNGTWIPTIVPPKKARAGVDQSCNRETGRWKLK